MPVSLPHRNPNNESPTSRWLTVFSSLSNKNFRYLWLGMMSMMGAVQVEMLAMGYLVYDITASPFLLTVVETGFAIPTLLLSLFGGALADRFDRKRMIQAGQGLAILVALAVTISILTDSITWKFLFLAALFEGTLFAFMMPARTSIVPQLVTKEQFTNAIALNSAAFSSMTLAAPAIGGILYAVFGPGVVYIVITILYITALITTSMISRPNTPATTIKTSVFGDIKEGVFYIFSSSKIIQLLSISVVGTLLNWPFRALLPLFIVDIYDLGPDAMGLMVSVLGAGSLVGSLAIASMGRWNRGLLLILSGLATSVGLALIASIPIYSIAVYIMILIGIGEATRWTLSMTLIMESAEDRFRGRVTSVFMMNFGFMPIAILPAGIAAEHLGGQLTIGIMAGILASATVLFLFYFQNIRKFH